MSRAPVGPDACDPRRARAARLGSRGRAVGAGSRRGAGRDRPGSGGARLSPSARDPLVDAVIALGNAERAKAGLPPLQRNTILVQAAQEYAGALAPGPCFAHTCGPIPALADRLARAGYTSWERIGENIAAGDLTAEAVMQGWMASPGHRANILKPEHQEIGVGVETGTGPYTIYWVQVFGARRP